MYIEQNILLRLDGLICDQYIPAYVLYTYNASTRIKKQQGI